MACINGFNPFIVSKFHHPIPSIPLIAIPIRPAYPLIKEYDTCPESLNGFKYKVTGQIVLNDGEEMISLADLCDALHAIWQPSLTWRIIPVGGQGYCYSLQFSSYKDLMKVAMSGPNKLFFSFFSFDCIQI